MAKVIIFGIKDFAELAHYYLRHDTEHEVVAFCVNAAYLPKDKVFHDLPIIAFEDIEKTHSPSEFKFFAPISPKSMNRVREEIYHKIKAKEYECISYISSKATIFNNVIGDNCFILENNTIQPFASIGNNCILWSGNHIGHHSKILDHVMFTSHVVLSGHTLVENYCTFGVNATIRDGLTIAEGTFVGMATSIVKDTEPWSMYKGNPAVKSDRSTKEQ